MNPAEASVRSYRPGSWFGIVGERAVVILPPTEKPRVAALWELVDAGAGFDVTLDALISGGLRDLPAFVLVSTGEGETKVVIRGPARAVFHVGDEVVELEGSQATTWVERSLLDVGSMTILLDEEPGEDVPSYVVDGGLFRISRLDEAPAHEGLDELVEEPAYEQEFPLYAEEGYDDGTDGEPEVEPDEPPVEPVRSPEPPAWTPEPPASPLVPPLPPVPPVPPLPPVPPVPPPPPVLPPLPDTDHDGDTLTGVWQPPVEPAPAAGAPVARLVLSNGDVVEVDRAVVIGRAPDARRYEDAEQPRLVTVTSPHLEISSTHLEVRPGSGADLGSAVVTDLGSTNGTVVVQPGLGPEDLPPGVPVQLVPGALIDLGDGVTIQVTSP